MWDAIRKRRCDVLVWASGCLESHEVRKCFIVQTRDKWLLKVSFSSYQMCFRFLGGVDNINWATDITF